MEEIKMEYIIETENKETEERILEAQQKGFLKIISKNKTPLDEIKNNVEQINESLIRLEKIGISKEIMVAYLRTKGISKRSVDSVLYHQQEFFKKLGFSK